MIVVDVETTGLDPSKHSIVSIGAIDFNNPSNQFYATCIAWEGADISEYALKINGFTYQQVLMNNEYTLEEAMEEFLDWAHGCEEKTIAGENPKFDLNFLADSAKRSGLKWNLGYRSVDVHTLCYAHQLNRNKKLPKKEGYSNLSLDKTLKYCGLPEEPKPHNALIGAKLEAEAINRLLYGNCLLKEYEQYRIPWHY